MAQTQSEKPPTPARQTGPASPERDPAGSKNEQNAGSNSDPIAMLRADHRRVEQLFGSFEKAGSAEQKSQLAKQICTELTIHTLIEEEIFYPACHANMEQRLLDEAQVEHDGAKALIIEIRAGSPDDQYFQAKVKVLSEDIKHHVQEEEKPGTGIFAKAKEGGIATPELAKRVAERKQELMEEAKGGSSRSAADAVLSRPNQCRDETSITGAQHGARIEFNHGTRARRARALRQRRRRSRLSPAFVRPQPGR
jgi:hemerythrin superfamily protein